MCRGRGPATGSTRRIDFGGSSLNRYPFCGKRCGN